MAVTPCGLKLRVDEADGGAHSARASHGQGGRYPVRKLMGCPPPLGGSKVGVITPKVTPVPLAGSAYLPPSGVA
jgi:hypothetical protein